MNIFFRLRQNTVVPTHVLGVLAGRDLSYEELRPWAESADVVIAADSAADGLIAIGIKPDIVIGDMDSTNVSEADVPLFVKIEDENYTDCDKLLKYVLRLPSAKLVLTGIEGNRFDHMLATLSSATAVASDMRLLLRMGLAYIVTYRSQAVSAGRFSVMPLPEATVSISGAAWPLDRERLRFGEKVSISNESSGSTLVTVHDGVALVLVESAEFPLPTW